MSLGGIGQAPEIFTLVSDERSPTAGQNAQMVPERLISQRALYDLAGARLVTIEERHSEACRPDFLPSAVIMSV